MEEREMAERRVEGNVSIDRLLLDLGDLARPRIASQRVEPGARGRRDRHSGYRAGGLRVGGLDLGGDPVSEKAARLRDVSLSGLGIEIGIERIELPASIST